MINRFNTFGCGALLLASVTPAIAQTTGESLQPTASTTRATTTQPFRVGNAIPPRYPINEALPTLWIIGDSTVRCGRDDGGGQMWGWGTPLADYFDLTKINVENYAMGGTSSRTFRSYKYWDPVLSKMKPGDSLMMQFGHNDASKVNDNSRARGTLSGNGDETEEIDNQLTGKHETVHSFGWYLRQFINDARGKGVKEFFIVSPVPKNAWKDGHIDHGFNARYVQWAQQEAKLDEVHFIDLNKMASEKLEAIGQEAVTANDFPPKEVIHSAWPGAVLNAQCVVGTLRDSNVPTITSALLPNPPANPAAPPPPARR